MVRHYAFTSQNYGNEIGAIENPYRVEDFAILVSADSWNGGFVEHIGYMDVRQSMFSSALLFASSMFADYFEGLSFNDFLVGISELYDGSWDIASTDAIPALSGKTVKEIRFFLNHPIVGWDLAPHRSNNLTDVAFNFSDNLVSSVPNNLRSSLANALRHVIWQALITAKYGADIANEAGNAHEENHNVDLNTLDFSGPNAESLADQTADLQNNVIGRHIGRLVTGYDTHDVVNKVLYYLGKYGLYIVKKNGDTYHVVKETYDKWEMLRESVDTLDSYGHFLAP